MFTQTVDSEMKKYIGWIKFPLLIGITLSSFAFAYWYIVSANNILSGQEVREISVTGEGKVASKPDIAVFTTSIVTQGKKAGEAQAENTTRSNAVLNFLKGKGVDKKDIKTTGYSVYPQYQLEPLCQPGTVSTANMPCPPRPPVISSYEVRYTVEVKVRNLDLVDDLLEGVVTSGANEVSSINFTVDNPDSVQEEARKKAIDDAKAKAQVIARDMGIILKRITGFSESGGPFPIYAYSAKAGVGGGMGGGMATPEVQPGEQEITSNVTITYEFR